MSQGTENATLWSSNTDEMRREEEGLQLHKQREDEQVGVMLEYMTQMIFSNSPEQQLIGTRHFRKLLRKTLDSNSPKNREIATRSVEFRLLEFLKRKEDRMLQFEAACALVNIDYKDYWRADLITGDAVPIFIEMLSSEVEDVLEQALSALRGNLRFTNYKSDCKILSFLIPLLTKRSCLTLMRKAVWTLSKVWRTHTDMNRYLKVLSRLLYENDTEILVNTCLVFSCIANRSEKQLHCILDLGVCGRLVQLIRHSDYQVVSAALEAVQSIANENQIYIQVILDCSVLQSLRYVFCNCSYFFMLDIICLTISNITAGNQSQIQMVIDEGLFPYVISLLDCDLLHLTINGVLVINNVTSRGSAEQIRYLVKLGCIKILCKSLIKRDTVNAGLIGLENILRQGKIETKRGRINPYCAVVRANGVHYLQHLESYKDEKIRQKALQLINDYFWPY